MSDKQPQLLKGQSLKEMAEHACTLAALGWGHFHRWQFVSARGTVYATDTYCVFFNAQEVAFTGSFSVFADREYKQKFMEIATVLYKHRFSLEALFEFMDNIRFANGAMKLAISDLVTYEESFNNHMKETGGVL